MDYEKKYKEALKRAKNHYSTTDSAADIKLIGLIFPELKESGDEKIRQALIRFHKSTIDVDGIKGDEIVSWLEKQGEKKSIDDLTPQEAMDIAVAKCFEQGEQKPVYNGKHKLLTVERAKEMSPFMRSCFEQKPTVIIPKFRIGDEIKTSNEESLTITKIDEKGYWSKDLFICDFDEECLWDLVEQKPAEEYNITGIGSKNAQGKLGEMIKNLKQEELTEFEKAVKQVMEEAIECGDTHNLKADADMLLRLVQKPTCGEEDERIRKELLSVVNDLVLPDEQQSRFVAWLEKQQKPADLKTKAGNWYTCYKEVMNENMVTAFHRGEIYYCPKDGYLDVSGALFEVGGLDVFRLVTEEEIPQTQPKQEWSDVDKDILFRTINDLKFLKDTVSKDPKYAVNIIDIEREITWLKSLKERYTWKPSDGHYELEEFAKIVRCNLTGISKAVQELFEAKYLQLTGNKMYGGFKD